MRKFGVTLALRLVFMGYIDEAEEEPEEVNKSTIGKSFFH